MEKITLLINKADNVLVACEDCKKGQYASYAKEDILLLDDIDLGHKIALKDIKKNEKIIKFGTSIGRSKKDIKRGEHVHLHNLKSDYIKV